MSEHELREPAFECFVAGIPRPQGSKTRTRNGGMRESSKYVGAWRSSVEFVALAQASEMRVKGVTLPLDGPLVLGAEFLVPRPGLTVKRVSGHFRKCPKVHMTASFAAQCPLCKGSYRALRDDAPVYVTCAPDTSKLIRAVEDSLTDAGVWTDDSRVVGYAGFPVTCKRYANPGEGPGVWLRVWRVG